MPFVISKDLDRPSHKDQCLLWLPPLKMYKVTQTTYRLKYTPLTVRLAVTLPQTDCVHGCARNFTLHPLALHFQVCVAAQNPKQNK
jgi:hypothetical protein